MNENKYTFFINDRLTAFEQRLNDIFFEEHEQLYLEGIKEQRIAYIEKEFKEYDKRKKRT